ncbi:hypothetical protein B0A67_18020 [Flavobacterium aquidurense]|jgi:hypothetical protein|uniref:hypothetical protein n=1 Tax=Flavobacterium aquidurense TaxID=362413 RepID=UPI0009355B4A|nr:hypothetical protein [Flavobacterium aquidurense]OXA69835.1 hypothetical protein B0A67_18020 [Flavobacterium aquidurense]
MTQIRYRETADLHGFYSKRNWSGFVRLSGVEALCVEKSILTKNKPASICLNPFHPRAIKKSLIYTNALALTK